MRASWILACASLSFACGPSDEPVDALVVVQETNLTSCQETHSYSRTVQRECTGSEVKVLVCSASELCEAQLNDLTSSVATCDNSTDNFHAQSFASCD